MLFTEDWLRQYCNPELSTEALAETLTMAGLEVEEVTSVALAFTGVVVAKVVTCRDHENSDHLHVCEVDAGTGELLQIVCGAPNVKAGVKAPCALVGAELPGGFKIKKSKLRGVVSMGMLCSARELGITEDHSGIWILPEDAPVGTDIREYAKLNDARIEVKLTPNRGDALSLIGIARDLHAVTGAPLTLPEMKPVAPTCDCRLPVRVEAPDLCGRFASRIIRNINARAETPAWMKERLERAGQRSISALVDISNYVMLELGRPTHFYDLDKIESDHLTVRWAKAGESVHLLDDSRYDVDGYYGVATPPNVSPASRAATRPRSRTTRRTSSSKPPSGTRSPFRVVPASSTSRRTPPTATNAASTSARTRRTSNTSRSSFSTSAARPKPRWARSTTSSRSFPNASPSRCAWTAASR